MTIEDNMKIATGMRRMGVMGHEVAKVEELLAEGKTVKEVADIMLCDESVIESFATEAKAEGHGHGHEETGKAYQPLAAGAAKEPAGGRRK